MFRSSFAPSQRQLRVGEQVRHIVSNMLQRGDLHDVIGENIVLSVSEVRMSSDLKVATCFISLLGTENGDLVVKALNSHTKFIRGRVASSLRQMKYIPEFRFRLDTSFENFSKIDALLRSPQVARDLRNHHNNNDNEKEHP